MSMSDSYYGKEFVWCMLHNGGGVRCVRPLCLLSLFLMRLTCLDLDLAVQGALRQLDALLIGPAARPRHARQHHGAYLHHRRRGLATLPCVRDGLMGWTPGGGGGRSA